jgi:glycosyltransferase involved in cell wall biosynthesis
MRAAVLARGSDLVGARILAAGLVTHHPEIRLTALVGAADRRRLRASEPFDVLLLRDVGQPGIEDLITTAPPEAVASVLRALLVRHLLRAGEEAVVLLPADAEVRGPLAALLDGLHHHRAVLVPRLTGALPNDGLRPDAADLLRAGEIDHELVAMRGDAAGLEFAEWWVERSYAAAEAVAPQGHNGTVPVPAEATPLDVASTVFAGLGRVEDPAYDVSVWNLHERSITGDVRLVRFTGFRPDRPWWLSSDGNRVLVLDDSELATACGERARAMRAAGWAPEAYEAADDELAPGIRLDDRLRRLHAEAVEHDERFGELDSAAAVEAFLTWLAESAPAGGAAGINRYAHDVWRERPDVQEAYPDLDGTSADGFIGWLWVHGREELGLQGALLPPPPAWAKEADRQAPAVLVAGYLRGTLGLGQAARAYVSAFQAVDVPVVTQTVSVDPAGSLAPRPDDTSFQELIADGVEPEIELLCVNADQLPELVRELDPGRRRYRIGHWAWETDAIPERWASSYALVDEVWTNSRYVAEHIGRASPVPVVVVPSPVEAPPVPAGPPPLDLPAERFVFLFVFDYFSTIERKNPVGLIEAFRRAFAPEEGPALVLKTIHAESRPQERERLRWVAGDRPDIRFIDATLPATQLHALFARADCYVSLHRSEGFGLTLAEAMALGKPVIGTAYGGNTDFMTPANSYLVEWAPTAVGPDAEHYPASGTWAEPSIEHAAALLREVWIDRDGAARRGERARADVETLLSPKAVGAIARARLARIAARRGAAPEAVQSWALDDAERQVLAGPDTGGRGPRAALRRRALRAMRPYTTAQRAVDEALVRALRRMEAELAADRAARDRDRLRIARLEAQLAELLESKLPRS